MGNFNLTDQTNLFKINYYKKSENMYNSENVLQGRIRKKHDFTGKQKFVSTPLSFSGGVGSGQLPIANAGTYEGAVITAKKVYARAEMEREAIKASQGKAGAFVEATRESVQKAVESYMRNSSRILFGDGSGILGRGAAGAANVTGNGSVGTPYLVYIATGTAFGAFKEANFEEKDHVQVVTGMNAGDNLGGTAEGTTTITNLLEIVAVDASTQKVSLVGTSAVLAGLVSGTAPLTQTSGLAMQRSYLLEPQGLDGVVNNSSLSMYGIAHQRRWSSTIQAAGGSGISVDKINLLLLDIRKKFGKTPKILMASFAQYRNLLALLEDQKIYNLPNRNLKGHMGFDGIEFQTSSGKLSVHVDRFVEDDRIYALNDDFIECHHRPGFGWFDDDGTVFMRKTDDDDYEARYGGYYENFITPTAHGVISGLAV